MIPHPLQATVLRLALAAATVVVLLLANPGGGAAPVPAASACATIVAAYPSANSSGFRQVCAEPAFVQAFDRYGVKNFTLGGASAADGPSFAYYTFYYLGACQNVSYGSVCSDQEYWSWNLTSGAVAGPLYASGPTACAGCPSVPPYESPAGAILVGIGVAAAVAVFATLSLRERRRRRRVASEARMPPPHAPRPPGPPA
jgi:hypothetical protein